MARPTSRIPLSADPLGEILHLLRPSGSFYCRAELTAPWGLDLPPLDGCMMFHVVTAGRCRLAIEGEAPVWLEAGNLALVPHGAGHRLASDDAVPLEPLFDIPVEKISERYEVMRHGGGGAPTETLCVVVQLEHEAAERLIAHLPRVLQIDAWNDDESGWIQSTLRLIAREAKTLKPGGETVITRLADVLVIQTIRAWIDAAAEPERGWLAALRDPQVGRALVAIHREPELPWTVASLAKESGMSRSAFSARFTELVGEPALHYLTQWRIQLARTRLRETSEPLSKIARHLGYTSEAAFSRAFKRVCGVSPGSVRREAARARSTSEG